MGFSSAPTFIQPSVEILGLRISEPVIALTDLLVAATAIYAWQRLRPLEPRHESIRFFRLFFLLIAVSTFCGGVFGHAFAHVFGFAGKVPAWLFSMVGMAALAHGSCLHSRPLFPVFFQNKLLAANLAGLLILAGLAVWNLTVFFTEMHTLFALVLLTGTAEALNLRLRGDRGSRFILWSFGFLVLAGLAHAAKLSFGPWFSYFDIAHVLMCGALWMILRGAEEKNWAAV